MKNSSKLQPEVSLLIRFTPDGKVTPEQTESLKDSIIMAASSIGFSGLSISSSIGDTKKRRRRIK